MLGYRVKRLCSVHTAISDLAGISWIPVRSRSQRKNLDERPYSRIMVKFLVFQPVTGRQYLRLRTASMTNAEILSQIWKNQYPPGQPRAHSLIEKVLVTPVVLLRFLSLDQIKATFSDKTRHVFMDCYVLSFMVILVAALTLSARLGIAGGIIAAYRIVDIFVYRAFFLLAKSQDSPWTHATLRRSLIVVIFNFFETVVAFAILYKVFGTIGATTSLIQGTFTSFTALYFSAVTAITLGYGDFIPLNQLSRMIVMFQLSGTMLFLIFIIPALLSLFSTDSK